jgi:hypothetical protein
MCIIAIVFLMVSLQLLKKVNDMNYETKIIKIELSDNNRIIEHVKIKGLICDDNVLIEQYWFYKLYPFGDDYAYLSTWIDGKIPHSSGVCYAKIMGRVR